MSIVTFVTSILNIYDETNDYTIKKNIPWRIERFRELAKTGIQICIYVSPDIEPLIREVEKEFSNTVKIMRVLTWDQTMIHGMLRTHCPDGYKLPENRKHEKDNAKYSIVINSKTEFMRHTIEHNPWNSTHFAWIDFNIVYVFSNPKYTLELLKWISSQPYIRPSCFINPGCLAKYDNSMDPFYMIGQVYWRFCGGFFLADRASILRFHELYLEYFPQFLRTYQTLVWEVNFWAWLEANSDWNPQWYLADHNDSIIGNISMDIFIQPLRDRGITELTYNYPIIPGYNASSASYVETSHGEHFLNTRYLNYLYHEEGYYQFYNEQRVIRTRNFFSKLHPQTLLPENFIEVEETVDFPQYEHGSRNLEDIRLYEYNGKIKYIATTMGYYSTGGTRMVVGDYRIEPTESGTQVYYENSRLINSPMEQWCEKNWIPIVLQNPNSPYHNRELFIYRWSPFEIGELVFPNLEMEDNDSETEYICLFGAKPPKQIPKSLPNLDLRIVARFDTSMCTFFWKMKGSSTFVDTGEYLVGVIHFTEETKPRSYYHMLVTLDRTTLCPLQYSDPFCFERIGIEFCIGFSIHSGQYLFWISRMDRDPLLMAIPQDHIPIYRRFL